MRKQILSAIESHSMITIFRHGHPDHDALGSQFGLASWLKENYPEKQIYCLGQERMHNDLYPFSDEVSDEMIASSLAIVVDTAGLHRVDDSRFINAAYKIRIDHHPQFDEGYDLQHVVSDAGSCSEIITDLIISYDKKISDKTAETLLRGIIADTLGFRTTNTTAYSLRMASVLAEYNVDLPQINREVFDTTQRRFELGTSFRSKAVIEQGLIYLILSKEECDELNITSTTAKELVAQFGGVKEFEVWAIFAQNTEGQYEGSLRSKTVTINDIASAYGGGGHKNACGIKGLSLQQVHQLLGDIKERLVNNNEPTKL